MRKITVLFVITKLELGGAQKQLLSLIRNIDQHKYTPVLFTAREGLLLPEAFAIAGLCVVTSGWMERPVHPLNDLAAFYEIFRLCKKRNVDIIHTHSSKAGILGRLAGRLAGVPVIVHTVHGWSFNDCQSRFMRGVSIWLEKIAAAVTDKLIVTSGHDRDKGLNAAIGKRDQYALISYGIDSRRFLGQATGFRDSLGIKSSDCVVTMIACLKPQKAVNDFVAAASLVAEKFPGARFLLVGDGEERAAVLASIRGKKLEGRFSLLGWRQDIPEILAASDIVVLTSLWEGLPIVVLEASAAAKPVVATHTGGVAEVVKDGQNGFLVAPGDVDAMAQKISLLLQDPALRQRFGEAARRAIAGRFTAEAMCEDTSALFAFLVKWKGIGHDN